MITKSVNLFIIFLLLFPQTSWSTGTKPDNPSGLRQHTVNTRVVLRKRHYLIYIPQTQKPLNTLPIYIVLHGAFSNAKEIIRSSGFNALAEKEKMIMIYPNGAYGLFGRFQHWNAGHCCGKAQADNTDDVGFIMKILQDIKIRYDITPNNIFLVGFSNGGMLAYRFAAEHSDIISGAAIVSGTIGGRASSNKPYWRIPEPQAPVPLLVFHGTQDKSVPYLGGTRPGKKTKREYDSVETSVNFWIKNNLCNSGPKEEYLLDGRVKKQLWFNSQSIPMVVLYSISEWGHYWPTDHPDAENFIPNFNTAQIIVDHFKQISGQ